jgi:hypothetical protein
VDDHGRPIKQYELCQPHAEQAEHELAKVRQIVKRN